MSQFISMTEAPPQPLAPVVAGMAADLRAMARQQAEEAGLRASVHALILSLLARLFGRLETMVRLWQAGQLPFPQTTPPVGRTSAAPSDSLPAPLARTSPWSWLASFFTPSGIVAPERAPRPRTPSLRGPAPSPRAASQSRHEPVPREPATHPPAPALRARPAGAWPCIPPTTSAPRAHITATARPGFSKPVPAAAPTFALIVPLS